ncbi:hypothetical protein WNY59_02970 [Ahrensia kielensis]|uniref:Uncharacterized protein n=1 Tax=Ahrensia kielensis TaxID=76980 RepID=A0ABU9T342_9HYPH
MFSGLDDYIKIGLMLLVFGVVIYFLTRSRSKKKIGNAPTGTTGRASRIGRQEEVPEVAQKKKQPDQKWGRGSED